MGISKNLMRIFGKLAIFGSSGVEIKSTTHREVTACVTSLLQINIHNIGKFNLPYTHCIVTPLGFQVH